MNDKNLWIAVVLSAAIILGYNYLVVEPQAQKRKAAIEAQRIEESLVAQTPGNDISPPSSSTTTTTTTTTSATDSFNAPQMRDMPGQAVSSPVMQDSAAAREQALAAASETIAIDAAAVRGRVNLEGARIDDLFLKNYFTSLDTVGEKEHQIELLAPVGSEDPYYAVHGWIGNASDLKDLPGPNTVWQNANGDQLSTGEGGSVKLSYASADGLLFERTITIDEHYMFAITDRVTNRSLKSASLSPYGLINRHGVPGDLQNFMILHEGFVGVLDGKLLMRKYKKMLKKGGTKHPEASGWLGITDKYWLTAMIPPKGEAFTSEYKIFGNSQNPAFQAVYVSPQRTIAPGESIDVTSHLFAGAKKVNILRSYQDKNGLGIEDFDRAVDWGHLFFLTEPIFLVLSFFGENIGNYGIAILLLTLCIKLILFPLANKSYVSMSAMRKLQPDIKKLRDRYADDKAKQQQEMMALYKKEKLNPLAGCLPVIVQIPVFFSLYKVLFVTIELRQAPFFGWIKDLSVPDPTSLFNLFGLLPYDPSTIPMVGNLLMVGVWPVLMGIGMWFQMKLNPPPQDPVQQQVFALMPFFFTFMLARFASGLVLYWTWNTALSMLQQYVIMRRMGVPVELGGRFKLPSFVKKLMPKADSGTDTSEEK